MHFVLTLYLLLQLVKLFFVTQIRVLILNLLIVIINPILILKAILLVLYLILLLLILRRWLWLPLRRIVLSILWTAFVVVFFLELWARHVVYLFLPHLIRVHWAFIIISLHLVFLGHHSFFSTWLVFFVNVIIVSFEVLNFIIEVVKLLLLDLLLLQKLLRVSIQ